MLRQQLQADFEYNLKLVEERDSELAKYEAALAELRLAIHHLTAENSELKVGLGYHDCVCSSACFSRCLLRTAGVLLPGRGSNTGRP